jgi:DNA-binding response OmpR family regulator
VQRPSGAATILVVEDDPSIADLVDVYLRRDGHDVLSVGTGAAALAAVTDRRPDVVVLDIGLPDMDGLDVCRRIRSDDPALGIIFLTARDDEVDRVLGLEFGADDYVTKPFSPRELVARVKALLRRAEVRIDGTDTPAVQRLGEVELDEGRREVRRDGVPVPLTTREFDLMAHLLRNRGLALTRRQLLDGAWGPDWIGDERTVDVHVRQLRRKLGDDLPLTTVWGVGYRLD